MLRQTAFAIALGTVGMLTAPVAEACVWDFGTPGQPPGLALNAPFASGTVFAGQASAGTACNSSLALSTSDPGALPLYNKSLGGVESGIGLVSDPSGENEVTPGHSIQIDIANVLNRTQTMGLSVAAASVQATEAWQLSDSNGVIISAGDNQVEHMFSSSSTVLTFTALAGNVLLSTFDAPEQPVGGVPEPASLALLGAALIGIGAMCKRRH